MSPRGPVAHLGGMNDQRPDTARALFDDFTAGDMRAHAAKHPDAKPMILNYAYRETYVVNIAGMPVGQIQWTFEQDESCFSDEDEIAAQAWGDHNGYYLKVSSLAVDPAFQRRGLGRLLLEHFLAYAELHHGERGWHPGRFTVDGAAFWKAVRDEDVPVTGRITFG